MASTSHQVSTSSQRQRYQGYPYVNPPAFGVPSIDPQTAAKWASLPRRPIGFPVRIQDQAGGSGINAKQGNDIVSPDSGTDTIKSDITDPDDNPVIYIDLPDDNQTYEAVIRPDSGTGTIKSDPDENPVVYIDLPDDNESDIVHRRDENKRDETRDLDEEPVVYIDMPEAGSSEVCERREQCEDGPSASVVQETILFDQFKNRRIEIASVQKEGESDNDSYDGGSQRILMQRPSPPNTLSINRWPDLGNQSNTQSSPVFLNPQDYMHRRISPEDGFDLRPLPISSFPDPPPAYSEIDQSPTPVTSPPPITSAPETTPADQRTTVIVNTPMGNTNRKYMACKHCGMMVHSLVVKQITFLTHVLAISMFFVGLFPIAILVYCFGYFKSKQHYCPNCTKMMTSEDPFKLCC